MEKRRPHCDLVSIKAAFVTVQSMRMNTTSYTFATISLGLADPEILALIQSVERKHFYKSMTSLVDHRVWQDVYHVPFQKLLLYIKFTTDDLGYFVISLKEK